MSSDPDVPEKRQVSAASERQRAAAGREQRAKGGGQRAESIGPRAQSEGPVKRGTRRAEGMGKGSGEKSRGEH
jgi:hypothetical protein